MNLKSSYDLPGNASKAYTIKDAVSRMYGQDDVFYLAYTGQSALVYDFIFDNVVSTERLTGQYLLHWAVSKPDRASMPNSIFGQNPNAVPIQNKKSVINYIFRRLNYEKVTDLLPIFLHANYWGESILHVAVASDAMTDEDTAELVMHLFSILRSAVKAEDLDRYQELFTCKTNGKLTVLDYAEKLGKPLTAQLLARKSILELETVEPENPGEHHSMTL